MIGVGAHVHHINEPNLELIVDKIAPQGSGTTWYVAHDVSGYTHYLPADQTEYHGRHRTPEPATVPSGPLPQGLVLETVRVPDHRWPLGRGATIRGVLRRPWFSFPPRHYALRSEHYLGGCA